MVNLRLTRDEAEMVLDLLERIAYSSEDYETINNSDYWRSEEISMSIRKQLKITPYDAGSNEE